MLNEEASRIKLAPKAIVETTCRAGNHYYFTIAIRLRTKYMAVQYFVFV
jgi:hypothetical protein